jgi:glycerate kinase
VIAHNGLDEAVDHADLIITGEGRLDNQTLMGKGPGHVIKLAHERNIPVAAICGAIDADFDPKRAGLLAAIGVSEGLQLEEAMDTTSTLNRVCIAARQLITKLKESSNDAMVK